MQTQTFVNPFKKKYYSVYVQVFKMFGRKIVVSVRNHPLKYDFDGLKE